MSGEMDKTYSSSEIQRIAKITKMQAIHWTQTGVITPLQDAQGRGSRRVYSWGNLIEMMICRELNRYKVERGIMANIIHAFNKPSSEFKNYWDYLKNNPKADNLYLVISIMHMQEVSEWLQNSIGDSKKTLKFLRDSLDKLSKYDPKLGQEKDRRKTNVKDGFLTTSTMVGKEELKVITETNRSCVVVNITVLIEEAKKG
jgi:hypothetical protein